MAANVWDCQRCVMCCSYGSLASTPGCSNFKLSDEVGQSLQPALPAGGFHKLTLRPRHGKNQLSTRAVTRSLFSPLVESFGNTQRNLSYDLNFLKKLNDSEASSAYEPATTPTQYQEQSGAGFNEVEEGNNSSQSAPQDPLAAAFGDGAHAEKFADIGHDFDMKRSTRARPPSMSLSQGISPSGRHALSHTLEAVGHPVNTAKLPGPTGFVMAFAVAALGLKTAAEKQGFLHVRPQKACEKCNGYGLQQCHVCQGRGVLIWEGKLWHTDPCALCFGRCLSKCSSCGGVKMKKGMPPAMVMKPKLKAGSNRN